jgi:hypothetical protein
MEVCGWTMLQVAPALREKTVEEVVSVDGFLCSNQDVVCGRVGKELS